MTEQELVSRAIESAPRAGIAWDNLVLSCVQWFKHMDQWEKFKFPTEYGEVFVQITMHAEYPESYDALPHHVLEKALNKSSDEKEST